MRTIIGIEKLTQILTTEQIEMLNQGADRQATQSNVTFTVLKVDSNQVEIEAAQGETKSGKYALEETLISRTKELFGKYFPDIELIVSPIPFSASRASMVTVEWLESINAAKRRTH